MQPLHFLLLSPSSYKDKLTAYTWVNQNVIPRLFSRSAGAALARFLLRILPWSNANIGFVHIRFIFPRSTIIAEIK